MLQVGDRVQLTAQGKLKYDSQAKGATGTVLRETSLESGWFDVKWDHGYENNYELDDLFVAVRVPVEIPAVAEQEAEQKEVEARVKYLYSVQTDTGYPIMSTRDREYAREVKADLGGKKEGIIIMAYAPVKEIR